MSPLVRSLLALACVALLHGACVRADAPLKLGPCDTLIIDPHPDPDYEGSVRVETAFFATPDGTDLAIPNACPATLDGLLTEIIEQRVTACASNSWLQLLSKSNDYGVMVSPIIATCDFPNCTELYVTVVQYCRPRNPRRKEIVPSPLIH